MIEFFRSRSARKEGKAVAPRVPDGQRVYAIGDIHGRSDLLAALIEAIEQEIESAGKVSCQIVLLGDLVDRGPDSAGVIKMARKWGKRRAVRILFGNHEEMFLKSFEDTDVLKHFLRFGGRETLLSYGMERKAFGKGSIAEIQAQLEEVVPKKDRKFIGNFEHLIRIGDYAFVHAGIEPGRPLDEQKNRNLRWIREPFLSHTKPHEAVVVHGHTISDEPVDAGNRIGVDTGAYASGRLTALVLEGTKRRYLSAVEKKSGKIRIEDS